MTTPFAMEGRELEAQSPFGKDEMTRRKKVTIWCAMGVAFTLAAIIGFFVVGPLVKGAPVGAEAQSKGMAKFASISAQMPHLANKARAMPVAPTPLQAVPA